jgi:hypothetical protein
MTHLIDVHPPRPYLAHVERSYLSFEVEAPSLELAHYLSKCTKVATRRDYARSLKLRHAIASCTNSTRHIGVAWCARVEGSPATNIVEASDACVLGGFPHQHEGPNSFPAKIYALAHQLGVSITPFGYIISGVDSILGRRANVAYEFPYGRVTSRWNQCENLGFRGIPGITIF